MSGQRNQLEGQHVVIIGGSSGIGLAAAEEAIAAGARITLVARNETRLADAAQALRERFTDARIDVAVADAADDVALANVLASLAPVDHVLITAGAATLSDLLGDPPLRTQTRAFDARVHAALVTVRTLASTMPASGSFVFTGGLSTDRPVKGAWVSGIGTAAAEQLARVLAVELAPQRVNAISPGWTDTPMWDDLLGEQKTAVFADVASRTPIGRLVRAQEAASAAVFLMTNGAITGEVLHIDGGQRLS